MRGIQNVGKEYRARIEWNSSREYIVGEPVTAKRQLKSFLVRLGGSSPQFHPPALRTVSTMNGSHKYSDTIRLLAFDSCGIAPQNRKISIIAAVSFRWRGH